MELFAEIDKERILIGTFESFIVRGIKLLGQQPGGHIVDLAMYTDFGHWRLSPETAMMAQKTDHRRTTNDLSTATKFFIEPAS